MSERTASYLAWLESQCGYKNVRLLSNGSWAAVYPLLFTAAIITGKIGDFSGYDDRWCYHSVDAATSALERWDGHGEPTGWHRHPATGRRVLADGSEDVFA